jgi:hypothetical protein
VSRATSPACSGQCPLTRREASTPCAAGPPVWLTAMPGAPWPPMSLFFLDTTKVVKSETLPSARAAPGTSAIAATTEAGTGLAAGCSGSFAPVARTTTSPALDLVSAVNDSPRVSVKMKEPATKATPRMTAKALMRSRSLRARRIWPGRRGTSVDPPRPVESRPHPLQDRSAVGRRSSSTTLPSARKTTRSVQLAAPGSWVTMTMVWPNSVDRPAQEPEHLGARRRVEVAGRLVGEDDLGPADERPGAGHALLLPPGQLGRSVREPVASARRCR